MRVCIFGAGAVGQAVGGLLADRGHEVVMLARPRLCAAIRREGLRIDGLFGEHYIPASRLTACDDPDSVAEHRPFDFVLLTVKSYDTAEALSRLARSDDGRAIIVSMQNGYGNVEALQRAFGVDRVLGGRVITGFEITRPAVVRITVHADDVSIGRWDGRPSPAADQLAAALAEAGLPTRSSQRVQAELWAKILYNCSLNALGAILGVVYGRLAERAETRELMDRIIDEAYAVLAAHDLPRLLPTAEAFRDQFYGQMVPATAAHAASMLQDLRAGKRTEIDALNGAIVTLGRQAGLDCPINQTAWAMVRFLESR